MVKWYKNNDEMQKDIRNQNRSRNVKFELTKIEETSEELRETNQSEPKPKKKKVSDNG